MKQLFLCHLIHFLCFLVCSQTHSAFFLFHLLCSVLESQSVESKNRRRFVSKNEGRTFVVVNGAFPLKV